MANAENDRLELVEDPIQERLERGQAWLNANRPLVYGAIGVLVAVMLGAQQYRVRTDARAAAASTQLFRGLQALNGGSVEDAHGIFLEISEEYGNTAAGQDARFYAGNALFAMGETGGAQAAYQDFIDANGGDGFLGRAARGGLAACAEEEGRYDEAARLYEAVGREVADVPSGARYLLNAARCLERAGDRTAARGLYEELSVDDAPLADEAARALALLGSA